MGSILEVYRFKCIVFLALFFVLTLHFKNSVGLKSGKKDSSSFNLFQFSNDIQIDSETNEKYKNSIEKDKKQMSIPIVINTWSFQEANAKAWEELSTGGSALDAVEVGARECEALQCDFTVGFGGSPDENGETTLDAMIMDGETHSVGAVGCLRRVKNAVGVARAVMDRTQHTLLVGELATDFAIKMGFTEESLSTPLSAQMHSEWKGNKCQPNFWRNVQPNPRENCGPYQIDKPFQDKPEPQKRIIDRYNHDTIGIVAVDSLGRIASATSSNGARNKIPGRVGDAPIAGAGSYVDKEVGGAAATGDGDIMVRFLPSLVAVESMRQGASPLEAVRGAISRIVRYYPSFSGAMVAVNLKGEYGAACHNIKTNTTLDGVDFPYCVANLATGQTSIYNVTCING